MIISASRRTDIPAFYSDWFFRRIEEGYVYVKNPLNPKQVSCISLRGDVVDGIVFWTKNPKPMLQNLDLMQNTPYYFQFTLTPYGKTIEPNINKVEVIETFKSLSARIGKSRVIWRYDPLILSPDFDEKYHYNQFERLSSRLSGFTEKCIVSFVDFYPKVKKQLLKIDAREIEESKKRLILKKLNEIAKNFGLKLETCAEDIDLEGLEVEPARCVDIELISRISGEKLKAQKDPNQRKACGCYSSIDIGAYDSCPHGCIYCYATYSHKLGSRMDEYDPNSPLLCSSLSESDVVTKRVVETFKVNQKSLFF